MANSSLPDKLLLNQNPKYSSSNLSSTMDSSFHTTEECQEVEDEDKDETSLGQEVRLQFLKSK